MNNFIRYFAFFAAIFLFTAANTFAQTPTKVTVEKAKEKVDSPQITRVDENTIKGLFAPKTENAKPLLVNFWATWCIPCREEFPDLVKIDEEYKGKIDFITISLDDLAEINRDVPQFLTEMNATMPAYLLYTSNENEVIGAISKDWSGGLPFTILLNAKREVVFTKQGKVKPEILRGEINNILSAEISQTLIVELPIPKIRSTNEGTEDAENDISKGILKIKRYGLTMAIPQNSVDEFKKKYDIEISETGCLLLFDTTAEYFTIYNEVMRREISKKFGTKFL